MTKKINLDYGQTDEALAKGFVELLSITDDYVNYEEMLMEGNTYPTSEVKLNISFGTNVYEVETTVTPDLMNAFCMWMESYVYANYGKEFRTADECLAWLKTL